MQGHWNWVRTWIAPTQKRNTSNHADQLDLKKKRNTSAVWVCSSTTSASGFSSPPSLGSTMARPQLWGGARGAIADVGRSEGAAAASALAASTGGIRGTVAIELGYRGWKMYRVLNILGWRVKFRGYYCRLPII